MEQFAFGTENGTSERVLQIMLSSDAFNMPAQHSAASSSGSSVTSQEEAFEEPTLRRAWLGSNRDAMCNVNSQPLSCSPTIKLSKEYAGVGRAR